MKEYNISPDKLYTVHEISQFKIKDFSSIQTIREYINEKKLRSVKANFGRTVYVKGRDLIEFIKIDA